MSVAFVNAEKCSLQKNYKIYFRKTITYLTRFDMQRQNDFATVDFRVFLVLMVFRYNFYHTLTIFAFEFHLNPLSGVVEANQNGIDAMVTRKRLYSENCHFLALAGIPYKYNHTYTTLGGSN